MDDKLQEIDDLFASLNVKESDVKTSFESQGKSFWIRKGSGFMRKKIPAAGFLSAMSNDPVGIMSGKYDTVVENLMNGVICKLDDGNLEDLSDGNYWDWIAKLPELDQLSIMGELPQVVAMITVGKPQTAELIRQSITSSQSSSDRESSNTTNQKEQTSEKKPKKPVRNLPKKQPSG